MVNKIDFSDFLPDLAMEEDNKTPQSEEINIDYEIKTINLKESIEKEDIKEELKDKNLNKNLQNKDEILQTVELETKQIYEENKNITNDIKISHNQLHEYRNKEEYNNINIDLGLNSDEQILIDQFNKTFDLVNNNFSKYNYIINEKEETEKFLGQISSVYRQSDEDLRNLKLAITTLKQWYNNHKENIINNLQKDINYMLNIFFTNNHQIKLEQDVQRNKSIVNMIEVDEKGDKIGDIAMILSGAEKQMTGFLIQSSILNTLNSNFVILDEAFSSFGNKEVKKLPEILKNLDNMQMIVIEHKDEMYEDFPVKTYRLDRDEEQGTYIVDVEIPEE